MVVCCGGRCGECWFEKMNFCVAMDEVNLFIYI